MDQQTKDLLKEILELLRTVSNTASQQSRKAYLGQFISSFSFDDEINQVIKKIESL